MFTGEFSLGVVLQFHAKFIFSTLFSKQTEFMQLINIYRVNENEQQ